MAEGFRRVVSHFSHHHPLKLIAYDPETLNLITSPCSACKLQPSSGMLYTCTVCQDYFLHQSCFEMPKKITHPFHKQHALALMPKSAYGDVRFKCDACGERGGGFSYHCKTCSFDLHMLCAMLPLSATHASHTMHNLKLSYESPYPNNKFSCDICTTLGSRQWLYRCKPCGFDAHLKCVAPGDDPVVSTPLSREPMKAQEAVMCLNLSPSAPELPAMQQQVKNNVIHDPPFEVKSKNNELAIEAVQQMIVNNSNVLAQAILEGKVCGDDRGLHLLIEWISALHNNSNGISGTGGDIPALDVFAAHGGDPTDHSVQIDDGGGRGQDSLQAVIGGGGGGSFPEKINHPFDKMHALTLLLEPAYSEGRFRCDACGERGKGYSYHCQPCGIDLHVSCAMMPLSVTHDSHVHKLGLAFKFPYPNNKFSCDICIKPGSRQWLYRCKSCGFNAHIKCAAGDVSRVHTMSRSKEPTPQEAATWGPPRPMMNSGFPTRRIPVNVPPFVVAGQNDELAIQQMNINKNNRANTGTAIAQGLMRLISNGVNTGTGGEQDYEQSLLGDGNGIDFLGALFGG